MQAVAGAKLYRRLNGKAHAADYEGIIVRLYRCVSPGCLLHFFAQRRRRGQLTVTNRQVFHRISAGRKESQLVVRELGTDVLPRLHEGMRARIADQANRSHDAKVSSKISSHCASPSSSGISGISLSGSSSAACGSPPRDESCSEKNIFMTASTPSCRTERKS